MSCSRDCCTHLHQKSMSSSKLSTALDHAGLAPHPGLGGNSSSEEPIQHTITDSPVHQSIGVVSSGLPGASTGPSASAAATATTAFHGASHVNTHASQSRGPLVQPSHASLFTSTPRDADSVSLADSDVAEASTSGASHAQSTKAQGTKHSSSSSSKSKLSNGTICGWNCVCYCGV